MKSKISNNVDSRYKMYASIPTVLKKTPLRSQSRGGGSSLDRGSQESRVRRMRNTSQDSAIEEKKKHAELRKQIAQKERQLVEMTQAAQRLKLKLGESGSIQTLKKVEPKKSRNTTRQQFGSQLSGGQKNRKSPAQGGGLRIPAKAMREELKTRLGSPLNTSTFERIPLRVRSNECSSGSPLRNKRSYSPPVRDYQPAARDTFGPAQSHRIREISFDNDVLDQNINTLNSRESGFNIRPVPIEYASNSNLTWLRTDAQRRDRMNTLSLDNQALQKRLNLVMEELQSLQRDKYQIQEKFQALKSENNRTTLVIKSSNPVDQQNKNIKDQIQLVQKDNGRTQLEIENEGNEIVQLQQGALDVSTQCKQLEIQLNSTNYEFKQILDKIESFHQRKVQLYKELEALNVLIDEQSRMEHSENLTNIDLDTSITKMQAERNKLLSTFENITIDFDKYVREIAAKTQRLHAKNKKQIKMIVAKIIFQRIEKMQKDRQEDGYKIFKKYCDFDAQCYGKLKAFKYIAYRLGQYKKHSALQRWYDNVLKPFGTRTQNYSLANFNSENILKSKVFHAWCKYQQSRVMIYKSKANSINIVWEKLLDSVLCDVKRAMVIWKEKNRFHNKKVKLYKRLMFLRQKQLTTAALLRWKNWSMRLEFDVRAEICKREYGQKIFLTQVFGALKQQIQLEKHMRELKQRKVLKSLKQNVAINQFNIRLNLATLRFRALNLRYHVKVCFDALRENKQKNKLKIMTVALNEDMDVTLEKHAKFRQRLENEIILKMKLNVCFILRTAMGRKLYSYFKNWKKLTIQYRETFRSKLKDQVCFAFRQSMLSYFLHWRKNASKMTILDKKYKIGEISKINQQNERNCLENEYRHNLELDVLKSIRNRKNNKVLKKFLMRLQSQAIQIWHEKVCATKHCQERNRRIFANMVKRLLSESFARYKQVYLKCKQHEKNLKKVTVIRQVLEAKSLRTIFNAYCAYILNHKKAKTFLWVIINRLDLWKKKRTFRIWIENGNVKVMHKLNLQIIENIDQIDHKNKQICLIEQDHQSGLKGVESCQKSLKLKSRKLLANYMQRYYSENTAMRFKFWKQQIVVSKQREAILKRTIAHMKKYQFIQVRNAFKHFMSLENVHNKKCKIKHTIWEQEEQIQQAIHNEEVHKSVVIQQKKHLTQIANEQAIYSKRFNIVVEAMSIRNIENLFSSRKRCIFEQWRQIAIQNKAFLLCIKNVLEKSMYMKGFFNIQNTRRFKTNREKLRRHMSMVFLKYTRQTTTNYFSKWKQVAMRQVVTRGLKLDNDNYICVERFSERVFNIKNQNTSNVFEYLRHRRLANVFKSWKNIKAHLKLKKKKEQEVKEIFANIKYRRSLQKWFLRTEATKRRRFCLKAIKQQNAWCIKRAVWDRFLWRKALSHDIAKTIAHLEHLFRSKNYVDSFQTIRSFSDSKKLACNNFKKKSANDTAYLLSNIHNNRVKRYFSKYKAIVRRCKFNDIMKKKILIKIDNVNLRDGFRVWANWNEKLRMIKELNETGPVTEFVFEGKRTMFNLIEFMRSEHYDEETIAYWVKYSIRMNEQQMSWLVKRLKIPRQDRCAMIKVMENWKMWIKIKKLFRYMIQKGNDSVTSVKCDMRWAFDHWKKADGAMAKYLDRHDFKTLKSMNIVQAKVLDQLAEREAENSAVISHLNVQRDELLDKYMISQKLALCLFGDNKRKDLEQCFSKWKLHCSIQAKEEGEAQIYRAVQTITHVKARAVEIQQINLGLAEDNDKLRQYTVDGFHVAKDVQLLSIQRDNLKEDLYAKDETIQRLLDDQRILRKQLEALGITEYEIVGHKANRFDIHHKPLRNTSPYRI